MSITDLVPPPPADDRIYGVVTGTVTNNNDDRKLGRVKVRFPWHADREESVWARVAVPLAGKGSGTWMIPAVDDEVLVAFEQGDRRFPYVVGSLWSEAPAAAQAAPPSAVPPQDGPPPAVPPQLGTGAASEVTVLCSRSGHVVRLDDRKGEETIEITDGSGKSSIVIRTKDNAITLTCQGDLTLESKGGRVLLKAAKGMEMEATGDVKVKGAHIDLN
jgi:uncharacterized protein involved in type VI secretion and phage assembly